MNAGRATNSQTAQRILRLCCEEAAGPRKLRNRLVGEYVEDRTELAANLGDARVFVPQLRSALDNVDRAIARLSPGSER